MNIILNLMYYYVGTSIFLSIQAIGDEVMESLLTERKEPIVRVLGKTRKFI